MAYIGYVSIPFGKKPTSAGKTVDFTKIYTKAIFSAPTFAATSESTEVFLFREDEPEPVWDERHIRRVRQHQRSLQHIERRLREEIQNHIILADFVIADISLLNPNVMLEVGFAQAVGKRIIYVTHTPALFPSNLGDLKRRYDYNLQDLPNLSRNLWHKIRDVIEEVQSEESLFEETGGGIEYYRDRKAIDLEERLATAKSIIQILTTNLTTVSANYVRAIVTALDKAKEEDRTLKVRILTSDPTNPFIESRARQLNENLQGYHGELEGSLTSIAGRLREEPNCSIRTYQDFPTQLWHRIDETIYIGAPSLIRRSRDNCVFAVFVNVPGIKETFLDHFDELEKRGLSYDPEQRPPSQSQERNRDPKSKSSGKSNVAKPTGATATKRRVPKKAAKKRATTPRAAKKDRKNKIQT